MQSTSAKSVSFCDDVDYASVVAYSTVYGLLPQDYVATTDGWKRASVHACHGAGRLADVMKLRLQQNATSHGHSAIVAFGRTMLRTCNACMHEDEPLLTPQSVAAVLASQESTVSGHRPQLISCPHRFMSMMKLRTHGRGSEWNSLLPETIFNTNWIIKECMSTVDRAPIPQ